MTLPESGTTRLASQACSQHHNLKSPCYDDLEIVLKMSVVTHFKELIRLVCTEKNRNNYGDSNYVCDMDVKPKESERKWEYNLMTR